MLESNLLRLVYLVHFLSFMPFLISVKIKIKIKIKIKNLCLNLIIAELVIS